MHDGLAVPSGWVRRFAHLVPPGATVLDLAAGGGRHTRFFAGRGNLVLAVDRRLEAMADLVGVPGIELLEADLEAAPWPLPDRRFAAIVVTNYLHRPLLPVLADSLATGGVLLYETFAAGNERFGKPSNPDFLLNPGELLDAVRGRLRVIAYQDGFINVPRASCVQRIVAAAPLRPTPTGLTERNNASDPVRYVLQG